MRALIVMFVLLAGAAGAQENLFFSPAGTENCIAGLDDPFRARDCIGSSSNTCMLTDDGGMTTVGMGYCMNREWQYWDGRLNRAYKKAMAGAKRIDVEMDDLGASAPKQAPALRDMQRAWIKFRDAKCDHASAQWGGGTGAGPASISCLMVETGEQALYLESIALGD